jgi:hypothetical protein
MRIQLVGAVHELPVADKLAENMSLPEEQKRIFELDAG